MRKYKRMTYEERVKIETLLGEKKFKHENGVIF